MPVALLDYDGYICKSFYANKEDLMDFENAEKILNDLVNASIKKAAKYFNCKQSDVKVIKVVSGHSWKKEIYPSYKRTRKRDEFLGVYRGIISGKKDVTIVQPLEADELLIMIADYMRAINDNSYIIFSDDKDLRYYTERYCKINITEQVNEQDPQELVYDQLAQMLIGDKEDNINGVPKIGEKTANKLLSNCGYTLENVINIFKEKEVDIDMTLRDLLLVVPLSDSYVKESEYGYRVAHSVLNNKIPDELDVFKAITSQLDFLNEKVNEVYKK